MKSGEAFRTISECFIPNEHSKKNKERKWHMSGLLFVYDNIIRIITDAILNDDWGFLFLMKCIANACNETMCIEPV